MHLPRKLTPPVIDTMSGVMQQAFRAERNYVLQRAGNIQHKDKVTDGSPVTEADRDVERRVQQTMTAAYPDIPVFGEETGYDEQNLPSVCWLVDPIDGTKHFIAGEPMFTGMAALMQDGAATACMIYNYTTDDMFTACVGAGAYKNGTRLNLRDVVLPPVAWCKQELIEPLNDILRPAGVHCEKVRGGGGFGFTQVVEGLVAARFQIHAGGYMHDYAPGGLLVREAGGEIVPVLDDAYTARSRSFVACHPALSAVLLPHAQQMRALEAAR